MAPLTKDTEATNSTTEASGSNRGASAKTEQAGHLRSDAVSLEVPVKVHGSRVTEVVREITPHTEPFEEQTSTMIVFPQGAVIRMSTSVSVGQMLVVTNSKTRQDAICRVVKVRTFSNLQGYVEVEFTHKQPGYWNVYFPSEGPATANKPAQPAPAAVEPVAPTIKKAPVASASDISWAPAPSAAVAEKPVEAPSFPSAVKPAVAPPQIDSTAKPEPSFISIGSQEQVQLAASTITPAPPTPITPSFETLKKPVQEKSHASNVIHFPPASSAEGHAANSFPELHASETQHGTSDSSELAQHVATMSDESAHGTFGSLSGGATLGMKHSTSAGTAEVNLDVYTGASAHPKTPSGQNWVLIAACIILLLAAVGAGVYYVRMHSVSSSSAKSNPPTLIQPAAAPVVDATQALPGSVPTPQASNPQGRAAIANTPPSIIVNGNAPAESHDSPAPSNRPASVAKQDAPHVTSDMMSATLNSHPVSSQRADGAQADAAPSFDGVAAPASSENGAMPGGMGASDVASPPEPEIKSEGPVKIGGLVKEPRLISSVLPVYPLFAKQAHIEGDVVVKTTIDKNGNVNHMEIVSGPNMLRQPALDALARWKYEPSKLNGQPVSVQLLVTLKFHR